MAWWHGLEGGPIAAQRPPPPDATAPYPNLASVPPKPSPIDAGLRARVSAGLAAERANATYEAASLPLKALPPKAANGLFAGAAPLPPPSPDAAGAALEAAPPSSPLASAPHVAAPPVAGPHGAGPETPPPPIADAPPQPPHIQGVSIPVTVPFLPPVAPPPPRSIEPALGAADRAPLALGFAAGSAILPAEMLPRLHTLAARRGSHGIDVVGFGETAASDALSQTQAVRLGVARARAVAVALRQDGVPMDALHLAATATGRGAAARLVE